METSLIIKLPSFNRPQKVEGPFNGEGSTAHSISGQSSFILDKTPNTPSSLESQSFEANNCSSIQ